MSDDQVMCLIHCGVQAADAGTVFSVQGFDVVLGADVCYSLKALPALFSVASQLLSKKPTSRFLLGYVSRYIINAIV